MRRLLPIFPIFALTALAGCGGVADDDVVRLCRLTLPVLNPENAAIRVLREVDAGERAVRIEYVVVSDRRSRQRWVLCRFDEATGQGRPTIVALQTDDGVVSGASLYLMERFWLGTPDAVAADPG